MVEGTDLLGLDAEVQDGQFTFAYLFPIRGTYVFDLVISPLPDGPEFSPVNLRQTLHLRENPAEVRNAWLLVSGLFILGGIAGGILARSAAVREALGTTPVLVLLGLCAHACLPGPAAAQAQQEPPGVERGAVWTLDVRPTPASATVGQLVQLAIVLSRNAQVFPHATRLAIEVRHVEDDTVVFQASPYAPHGRAVQRLQFFDGAPHTVTVTAYPADADNAPLTPLQAVVPINVAALHPPLAVKIRTLVLLLSVLVAGMMAGFFFAGRRRRHSHA
jgi:hypothetical protein